MQFFGENKRCIMFKILLNTIKDTFLSFDNRGLFFEVVRLHYYVNLLKSELKFLQDKDRINCKVIREQKNEIDGLKQILDIEQIKRDIDWHFSEFQKKYKGV